MMPINSCNRMATFFGLAVVFAISAQSPARAGDSTGPVIAAPRWSAQPTTLVDAQERTFQNGTVKLSGTLYAPKVEGCVPAVIVFHAASSPTRDIPLYRHLVEMLPPLGIAVFVFDRRGSGKSGELRDNDGSRLFVVTRTSESSWAS